MGRNETVFALTYIYIGQASRLSDVKLNKRNEIFSKCRHIDKKRLCNIGWIFPPIISIFYLIVMFYFLFGIVTIIYVSVKFIPLWFLKIVSWMLIWNKPVESWTFFLFDPPIMNLYITSCLYTLLCQSVFLSYISQPFLIWMD